MEFDVIVLGGGLGGLFGAAKLAKEGKKVALLEQHNKVGGYATYFKRSGFHFEASLHALDGLFVENDKSINNAHSILDEFGLFDTLNIIRLGEFYRVLGDKIDLIIPDKQADVIKLLKEKFPNEHDEIDNFFTVANKVYFQTIKIRDISLKDILLLPFFIGSIKDVIVYLKKSLGTVFKHSKMSEELKIILGANASYYHNDPEEYSSIHFFAAQSSYFLGGASQIEGGSYELVKQLSNIIENYGGKIFLNSEVKEILINNNHTSGVSYYDKREKIDKKLYSKALLGNMPFPNIINSLPDKYKNKLNNKYKRYKISPSVFVVYLGLKKPLSSLGIHNYSTIILPHQYKDFCDMFHHNYSDNYGERILYLTNYSSLDLFPQTGNKPTATCLVLDKQGDWSTLSDEEYKQKKDQHEEEIIAAMEKRFPGFRDNIEITSVSTPKTFARYTSNPEGAIYGFAQDINQLGPKRPSYRSPVKGLYIASAWTSPGGGMMPTVKSGYLAAQEILKREF